MQLLNTALDGIRGIRNAIGAFGVLRIKRSLGGLHRIAALPAAFLLHDRQNEVDISAHAVLRGYLRHGAGIGAYASTDGIAAHCDRAGDCAGVFPDVRKDVWV